MPSRQIIHYDDVVNQICKYVTVDEVKETVSQAEAMRVYALRAKDRLLLDKAVEVKFLAQVKGGEILIEMAEKGQRASDGGPGRGKRSQRATVLPTLSDLKLTKTESSRWQALARMNKAARTERLKLAQRKARAAIDTVAKQLRVELRAADEARVRALRPIEGKFKTIVVDPPWDYEWLSIAGRASPGYATMDHEQLMGMKIQKWAEDNAHMYLWVTNNFMTRGVELMRRWVRKPKRSNRSIFRWTDRTEHSAFAAIRSCDGQHNPFSSAWSQIASNMSLVLASPLQFCLNAHAIASTLMSNPLFPS